MKVHFSNNPKSQLAAPLSAQTSQINTTEMTNHIKTVTLGCKVNEYESRIIEQELLKLGFKEPVIVINTCTVTKEADRQSRQAIRKSIRQYEQQHFVKPKVVVTGCYAQMRPQEIANIGGVDLVIGNDQKMNIPQLLLQQCNNNQSLDNILVGDVDEFVSLPDGILGDFEGQTRAFIQIQQGCNQGCTFCIIHKVRGYSQSFKKQQVVAQAKRLLNIGFKELVICGVDLGSYGDDFNDGIATRNDDGANLVSLLKDLLNINHDSEYRIRLSSIDPAHISDELIDLFKHPRLCPHIHLSLQSGADLILKRMKRRYLFDAAYKAINKIRIIRPNLVLSADIIVGFPTETQAHFEASLAATKLLKISFPHTFMYSNREGTPASKIKQQVPTNIKKYRSDTLRTLGNKIKDDEFRSHLGQIMQVLVENRQDKDGHYFSRADNYLPIKVLNKDAQKSTFQKSANDCNRLQANTWQQVRIIDKNDDFLIAELLDKD